MEGKPASSEYKSYVVKKDYNYGESSEFNYMCENPNNRDFYGKYKEERSQLDYNYHKNYQPNRQYFQDSLLAQFQFTKIRDGKNKEFFCERPTENWIVFTAGPMGAGKGHCLNWLQNNNLFPLDAFVHVDPDMIRALLPENDAYNRIDPFTAGFRTQKEVGYMSEVSHLC